MSGAQGCVTLLISSLFAWGQACWTWFTAPEVVSAASLVSLAVNLAILVLVWARLKKHRNLSPTPYPKTSTMLAIAVAVVVVCLIGWACFESPRLVSIAPLVPVPFSLIAIVMVWVTVIKHEIASNPPDAPMTPVLAKAVVVVVVCFAFGVTLAISASRPAADARNEDQRKHVNPSDKPQHDILTRNIGTGQAARNHVIAPMVVETSLPMLTPPELAFYLEVQHICQEWSLKRNADSIVRRILRIIEGRERSSGLAEITDLLLSEFKAAEIGIILSHVASPTCEQRSLYEWYVAWRDDPSRGGSITRRIIGEEVERLLTREKYLTIQGILRDNRERHTASAIDGPDETALDALITETGYKSYEELFDRVRQAAIDKIDPEVTRAYQEALSGQR